MSLIETAPFVDMILHTSMESDRLGKSSPKKDCW